MTDNDEEIYPLPKLASLLEREELARIILTSALEKVETLGFTVKVGTRNGRSMKILLAKENIYLYHPDKP